MLSNINNRNRNDTHIGLSEHTSTYFSNNIDNHQPDQQLNHRTNESSNSKGWSSDTIQTTIVDSKDDLYAEDDLGFDPFHETQKALAEMLESESKLQNIYSSSQSPPNFSNATSQQQIVTNVIHQINTSSQHQSSTTNGTGSGMPNL